MKYFLAMLVFGLTFLLQPHSAFAARCDSNAGYKCQSNCLNADTLTGLFEDCSGGDVCCKGSVEITPGVCSGNSTNSAGTCKNICANNEIADGVCTAQSGADYANQNCCVVRVVATAGMCVGTSTKVGGACRSNCATAEKVDGTCTAQSGADYANQNCCVSTSATANGGDSSGTTFTNPLAFNTVEELLTRIMTTVQKIIVTLALVTMLIGALLYVTSAGAEKQVTQAKEAISAALIGLALGIAAPSMLKELSNILGWNSTNSTVSNSLTLSAIAINVLNFLLGIFGILSLIMMIIGASLYLTSAGDEDRIDKGKDIFKYAVLGIIVAMSAMVLLRQIAVFFV